ncbi:hypothetical protein Mal4_01560 [Maioricimonas rarisocia]|uniref:Uncharacterized protein n=1 Tax=Maioricimonas rarisocia TaxID=2528026 RepID=A0A517Z061_9PLAN|nr:hypothetical protein [Maioricimonas rarisocia]QDU35874.1 hypothetical protein Mal4_01560 [Maioricimonas rarisocia]
MSLHIMDIPESQAELAGWLEEHLVGLQLGELVAELSAVHADSNGESVTLEQLLGDELPVALTKGLGAISPAKLRGLLQHPQLLLNLQEHLLFDAGEYWQKHPARSSEMDDLSERSWRILAPAIAPPPSAPASDRPRPQPRSGGTAARSRMPWSAIATTAATIMLAALVLHETGYLKFDPDPGNAVAVQPAPAPETPEDPVTPDSPAPAASGWGWERPGALPTGVEDGVYLNTLANSAYEWFRKRPQDREAVAKRIEQFRSGCDVLIHADHPPLAQEDQMWLRERCLAWRDKLDSHLAALEEGADPVTIREQADETINKLISALRSRAETLS